jgi:hypothetical protein
LLKTTWARFSNFWSSIRATKSTSFVLTILQIPLSPIFQFLKFNKGHQKHKLCINNPTNPLELDHLNQCRKSNKILPLEPGNFPTFLLHKCVKGGAIWMQRFVAFAKRITSGFMILVYKKQNISTTLFLVMMTGTPYTIYSIASTFNWIINYKNSLTRCQMGVNLKVVKPKSSIVHAHLHLC